MDIVGKYLCWDYFCALDYRLELFLFIGVSWIYVCRITYNWIIYIQIPEQLLYIYMKSVVWS